MMTELIDSLPSQSRIVIFGAGQAGVNFYRSLQKRRKDIEVAFFLDTYKSGMICEKKIILFSNFINDPESYEFEHIVIASMYHLEIEKQLKKSGISDFFTAASPGNANTITNVENRYPSPAFQRFQYDMITKGVSKQEYSFGYHLASIIVLVFNNIEHTSRSLESLVNCTHFPYELIIVDNGSNAPTKQWLRKFLQNHQEKNIQLIECSPEPGWTRQKKIYSAKNLALEKASGDLLVINDNDLAYEPFWLYYAAYLLHLFPEAGLLGLQRYKGKTHQILEILNRKMARVFSMNTVEGCNLILSRPMHEIMGNFKESPQTYGEPFANYKGCDVEFTYRVRSSGYLCIVPDQDVIKHIQQPRRYC